MADHLTPEVEYRDLLTAARLNVAHADHLGPQDSITPNLVQLAQAQAAIAQTEALIELVEQQRLANIIAWQALTNESNRTIIRRGLGLWTPDPKDIA